MLRFGKVWGIRFLMFELTMFEILFGLFVGHAMGDFGLQSDWMARHKNRHVKENNVRSARRELIWVQVMSSHCLIHAGAVALVTGSVVLGVFEFIAHWIIDFCKCEDWFGFHTDQILHMLCKVIWVLLLASGWIH